MLSMYRTLTVGLASAALVSAAGAAPIVDPGSTYFFRVFNQVDSGVTLNGMVFDGLPSNHTIAGRNLTMSESQTDNGDGTWTIVLAMTSDIDLSPGDVVFSRFGHGDPLDLLAPVRLTAAVLNFSGTNASGAASSLEGDVVTGLEAASREPWTGYFGDLPSEGWGYTGISGWDVRSVSWTLTVQRIPEPAPLALVGLALAALAWTRRKA